MSPDSSSLLYTVNTDYLSKYCDYYKFFLVEELAFVTDYSELHYGRCSTIGRLYKKYNGSYLLENIRLNNLPSVYTLPVGTATIRLLCLNSHVLLQNGSFYQVFGELVIVHNNKPEKNHIAKTSRGVQEQLQIIENFEAREVFLNKLSTTYKPAIRIWHANLIDRADELTERNLAIRSILDPETNN